MNVDEMDLLGQNLKTEPLDPQAYDRARAQLRAAVAADSRKTRVPMPRFGLLRNRSVVGLGAGVGALAAGAALVFAVTATSSPTTPVAPTTQADGVSQAPTVESPLITLAAQITATSDQQPGDASLVIRTQTTGNHSPEVSYNLYGDNGSFYGGADTRSLQQAIDANETSDQGVSAAEVAAARSAVDGDLTDARIALVNASPNPLGLGLSSTERQRIWDEQMGRSADIYKAKGVATPKDAPTGQRLADLTGNYVWNNGVDALTAAGGDAGVRAGILRIFSSVPGISVRKSTTDGKPTLTLTAGSALFSGAPAETLTIDRSSGTPIRLTAPAAGDSPASVSTYEVSRVSIDDIKS